MPSLPDLHGDGREIDLGRHELALPQLAGQPPARLATGQQVPYDRSILFRPELPEKEVEQQPAIEVLHLSTAICGHNTTLPDRSVQSALPGLQGASLASSRRQRSSRRYPHAYLS